MKNIVAEARQVAIGVIGCVDGDTHESPHAAEMVSAAQEIANALASCENAFREGDHSSVVVARNAIEAIARRFYRLATTGADGVRTRGKP